MGKITVEQKGDMYIIKNKLVHPELINERILNDMMHGQYPAFAQITECSASWIEAQINECVTLADYFNIYPTRQSFLNIVNQIMMIINDCATGLINESNIDLDLKRVFVNPNSGLVKLLYWPIANPQSELQMRSFFEGIARIINMRKADDAAFLYQYAEYFDQNSSFSINSFDRFLNDISLAKAVSLRNEDFLYDNPIGMQEQQNIPVQPQNVFADPIYQAEEQPVQQVYTWEQNVGENINFQPVQNHGVTPNNGFVPNHSANNFQGPAQVKARKAWLVNSVTASRHAINKPYFTIGRRHDRDCCIAGNKYVSGTHADILTRNGRFYIIDQGSLSGTYVNGNPASAGTEVELFNNDKIRIANVQFVFEIKD